MTATPRGWHDGPMESVTTADAEEAATAARFYVGPTTTLGLALDAGYDPAADWDER